MINKLPMNLNVLHLGYEFNAAIFPDALPNKLLKIYFSARYNKPINFKLPNTLYLLSFGHDFNYNIDNVKLPISLRQLIFGDNFNQPLNVMFPEILSEIFFGVCFNQPLVHLPKSIKTLTFGHNYIQDISQVNFHHIEIIHDYSSKISLDSCAFPTTLREIVHYVFNEQDGDYEQYIIYKRPIGQFTKMAIRNS
jgi:hypothetical protein